MAALSNTENKNRLEKWVGLARFFPDLKQVTHQWRLVIISISNEATMIDMIWKAVLIWKHILAVYLSSTVTKNTKANSVETINSCRMVSCQILAYFSPEWHRLHKTIPSLWNPPLDCSEFHIFLDDLVILQCYTKYFFTHTKDYLSDNVVLLCTYMQVFISQEEIIIFI